MNGKGWSVAIFLGGLVVGGAVGYVGLWKAMSDYRTTVETNFARSSEVAALDERVDTLERDIHTQLSALNTKVGVLVDRSNRDEQRR